MKIKILSSFLSLFTISVMISSCYQEVPQLYGNDFKWCGYKLQAWGTSITDAPGYLDGKGIYASWFVANRIRIDSLINRTDPGYNNRNLLQYNNAHNWGHPGSKANEIADDYFTIGKDGYQQGNGNSSQILELCRNSRFDTALIRTSLNRILSDLRAHNNNRYLVAGESKMNSHDEDTSTAAGKMMNAFDFSLIRDLGAHYVSFASFFHKWQTPYELVNEFIPKQFTLNYDPNVPGSGDGLHPNQAGVQIIGEGMGDMLEHCTGPIVNMNLSY